MPRTSRSSSPSTSSRAWKTWPRRSAAGPDLLRGGARRGADRPDRAHLDASHRGRRDSGGEADRLVQVARLDHVEARQLLLGLGERTVAHADLAVAHAHGGGRLDGLQRLGGDAVAALPDRAVVFEAVLVVDPGDGVFFAVDEAKVFHWLLTLFGNLRLW